MNAAPITPTEIGSSKPNNRPPQRIAIGGAKISFAARRVGASSLQSRSQLSQRSPWPITWCAQRVIVQRPHCITGAVTQSSQLVRETPML
jgi:hypothetical protein